MSIKRSSVIAELWLCRRPIHRGQGNYTFPQGFLKRLVPRFCNESPGLHLFCGGARVDNAINVDIDPGSAADIIATAEHLPFPDNTFTWVLADPPFSEEWAKIIWERELPPLRKVQREIVRVTKPGGRIMWFHLRPFLWPRGCRTIAYIAVMAGGRNRVRLLHILQKGLMPGEPRYSP